MPQPVPVQALLASARQQLAEAGCATPALGAEILLAHTLGRERTWLYVHSQEKIDLEQIAVFNRLLQRRARREPVAYLVGSKEFFGLEFWVNQHVLIPRPETELLVETALDFVNDRWPLDNAEGPTQFAQSTQSWSDRAREIYIVDVGTGSGCIAIAMATRLPGAMLFAIDASAEALTLARQNAGRHNVVDRITFLRGNLLHPLDRPVDLIVSNPPYVSRSELRAVSPEISQYEPRLALDGGEDGLALIGPLLRQATEKLRPGGAMLVEIGSTQGPAAVQLAQDCLPSADVSVKKDLAGLDRLLVVRS
jgi:release factor glutamine methyltransferase